MEQEPNQNKDKDKEQNQDQSKGQKSEELYRISISKAAERALTGAVERINDGFVGGRVSRTQIANWVLARFGESMTDAEVREIRTEHFDEVALLEVALKQAKTTGKLPPELRSLLQRQMLGGTDEPAKKRAPKKELDS